MSENTSEEITKNVFNAALELIRKDDVRKILLEEKNNNKNDALNKFLKKYNLTTSSSARIFSIIERVDYIKTKRPIIAPPIKDNKEEEINKIRKMLLESFTHIRWTFLVSMGMSVILFLVGLVFLFTAISKSFAETNVSTSTLTIAGIGISDFILLFYTRPWQDISKNLSNNQQIKMIATSYLSGLSILDDKEKVKSLNSLTKNSVSMIQKFSEEELDENK
jgi:hypothetical protein